MYLTPTTKITVHGMVGAINFEMKLIEKALREAGFNVVVDNSAGDWKVSASEGWFEKVLKHNREKQESIELIAKHIPWGG